MMVHVLEILLRLVNTPRFSARRDTTGGGGEIHRCCRGGHTNTSELNY